MHVRCRHEPAGPHDRLEDDAPAVCLGRRLVEDEPLAGDGVLDLVSAWNISLPPLRVTDTKSFRRSGCDYVGRKRDPHSAARAIRSPPGGGCR